MRVPSWTTAFVFLLLCCVSSLSIFEAEASPRKTLRYGGGGQGPVVFDGPQHAARGFSCNDCHLSLFTTRQQMRINLNDHFKGKSCFACHNDVQVSRKCGNCHRKFEGQPLSVTKGMSMSPEAGPTPPPSPPRSREQLQSPLTYDGFAGLGLKVMPEAARVFSAKTGVPFGGVTSTICSTGYMSVASGTASFGGMADYLTHAQKSQVAAWQLIGYDALAVYVHPSNSIKNFDLRSLVRIFSGAVINWKTLGGVDLPIRIYAEPASPGHSTMSFFKELVLGKRHYTRMTLMSVQDCLTAAASDPGAITVASLAYATDTLPPAHVDGVWPDKASVASGAYVLRRPIHLVTLQPTGNIQDFFEFMLSPVGQQIVAKHFVPLK